MNKKYVPLDLKELISEEIDESDIIALENTLFRKKYICTQIETDNLVLVSAENNDVLKMFENKKEFIKFVKEFMARNFID